MTGKRIIIIAAVIFILMLDIAGSILIHPDNPENTNQKQLLPGMEVNNIFFAQDFEYLSMYGDPKNWDDEKDMAIDKNGDGENDIIFKIASSKYEGIDLRGSVRQTDGSWKSMNFWSADLYGLFKSYLQDKSQERVIKAKDFLTLDTAGLFYLLQEGKYIVRGGCIVDDDYVQISFATLMKMDWTKY